MLKMLTFWMEPQLYEDTIDELKIGWFETKHKKAKSQKSDDRFK